MIYKSEYSIVTISKPGYCFSHLLISELTSYTKTSAMRFCFKNHSHTDTRLIPGRREIVNK
jgi:hypothetical protein